MSQYIAERRLTFSAKGEAARFPLVIRDLAPYKAQGAHPMVIFYEDAAGCTVEFDGFPGMKAQEAYGTDSLRALQLTIDIEPILRRFSKQYDFFFPSVESYFEEWLPAEAEHAHD